MAVPFGWIFILEPRPFSSSTLHSGIVAELPGINSINFGESAGVPYFIDS
jgi:hypothetical protein